jgi:hypothetical protein
MRARESEKGEIESERQEHLVAPPMLVRAAPVHTGARGCGGAPGACARFSGGRAMCSAGDGGGRAARVAAGLPACALALANMLLDFLRCAIGLGWYSYTSSFTTSIAKQPILCPTLWLASLKTHSHRVKHMVKLQKHDSLPRS